MQVFFIIFSLMLMLFAPNQAHAASLRSDKFTLDSSLIPPPFQNKITPFATEQPLHISLSSDRIGYGPLSPTNAIKRKISISNSTNGALFVFEDHPLKDDDSEIADTTCDQGTCTEKVASEWLNPFTFGLGFSRDEKLYQQFPDTSRKESMIPIAQDTLPITEAQEEVTNLFIKLNVNQNQATTSKNYTNIITFLALPKL